MSGNLFGSCINGNPCPKLNCRTSGRRWIDPTYPQFGQTTPAFQTDEINNIPTNSQRTVYGGLLNSRRIKQHASMHILAKGSLTTFNPINSLPFKDTMPQGVNGRNDCPPANPCVSYTNVGGPGDQTKSIPLGITGFVRGNKARLYSMPGKHDGVDTKHDSYTRYLMRKKGRALRCSNC